MDWNPAAPPRPGEEIDAARIGAWLGKDVTVAQFPAGHSNLTYLVRAGGEEYVLRRPPFGTQVKTAHDMGREFRVLSKLHAVYPPAPKPYAYCEDPSVIGAPFYLMERRHGTVIRKETPRELEESPDLCRRLSQSMVANLALLHSVDFEAAGLKDLGKPEGYVRRQIEGWSKRWTVAQTGPVPEMDELAVWLAARMPTESGAAIIHNDYKLDNMLLDPTDLTRITGVLDWEMATVGDPLMDLGTALSYWVEPTDPPEFLEARLAPTATPGFYTRAEAVERYAEITGRDVSGIAYYYVYGLFKLAVILQQIYYRYAHGLTRDHRFAGFGGVVLSLARQGVRAISSSR
ncbi:MAG: phosphotransferase family protein [Acidobacteria bacterium]|nr:phosphotransferase family protein [Acidobacteriota bacterium]